ncbi:MAG TPA: hypothetical protein VEJ89_00710 [Myxococcaceae bacterium]|nr:hypothetical protein [Myxococcaceae bacterium]
MSFRTRAVELVFRVLGVLVLAVAAIHLYATSLVRDHVLARIDEARLRALVSPGYLLDHVLVGVLLVPIGFLMVWSSGALGHGRRWAYVVNLSFSLAFLTMPPLVLGLAAGPELGAPAFALAAALVSVVAAGSLGVLLWARGDYRSEPS